MQIKDCYDDEYDFEVAVSTAIKNAHTKWEKSFVQDIHTRYLQYGKEIFIAKGAFRKLTELQVPYEQRKFGDLYLGENLSYEDVKEIELSFCAPKVYPTEQALLLIGENTVKKIIKATREQLVELIAHQARNRIFSVIFIKKDGTKRKMLCRFGVTSKLKGGKSTLDANSFFTLYDMQKHEYRAVNKETLLAVTLNKVIFTCEQDNETNSNV